MATSNRYSFGAIQAVPALGDFLDIVLSRTQRKTPTVVHKGYAISRIREFYLRKVKFTAATFDEKLGHILDEFPRLDDVHPFYADLMNVLYDKDHYKLALGQINTARHLIETVGKEYCKLLKFGDSLFRCKQLKRAALGRMATIMKRQKDALAYLEQVRQHLSRLPSIDPNARTLLLCGFPNVGKSSFMNLVTRADVDVQPYAFTTKSLFVGHMDYRYMSWQVIDTPGILDHALEERNTIEMQSITALAHLRACVLFFLDVSGSCGYSVAAQAALFRSIAPLFAGKPVLIVLSKADLARPESLAEGSEERVLLQGLLDEGYAMMPASAVTQENIMAVRNAAAERLLAQRVEAKVRGQKLGDVLNRLHLAQPAPRDAKARLAFIPEAVLAKRAGAVLETPHTLARDVEAANGGPGVYNVDLRANYILADDAWKADAIPEIVDGKNVADFVDPEIEARLLRLEAEEDEMLARGVYDAAEDGLRLSPEQRELRETARAIRRRQKVLAIESRLRSGKASKPVIVARHRRTPAASSAMDVDGSRRHSLGAAPKSDRSVSGLRGEARDAAGAGRVAAVRKMARAAQVPRNADARKGEADRRVLIARPKHLFSGKRSSGTASHR